MLASPAMPFAVLFVALIVIVTACAQPARAADPVRGEQLFMTPPRPGQLICADCHSDNPQANNFGNIWSGRNGVALIQRAVQNNTGGMGVFQSLFTATDFADIAAFLGNAPNRLRFAETVQGATSAAQTVSIASSLKQDLAGLSLAVEGDYVIAASRCGSSLPRFDQCSVDVAFRPTGEGSRAGTLVITHDGTPTPVRLPLEGSSPRLPRAVASVAPAALDFGSAVLGSDGALRHAALANHSSDALTLLGVSTSAADFVVAGGSCVAGVRLTTGQRCIVALRFAPRSGGQRSATLNLAHDGVGGLASVALQGLAGSGADERLVSDTTAIDFGSLLPGQRSSERSIVWTQAGNGTLATAAAQTSDVRFVITENRCSGAVAPWQRCETRVAFAPTRAVATSGELRIGQSLRIALFGRGSSTGELLAEPTLLGFDEALGMTRSCSLTLRNGGVGPLRLTTLALQGPEAADFLINADGGDSTCRTGATLAPAQACSVTLRFTPRAAGQRSARLVLDSDVGSRAVELIGRGRTTPMPQATLGAAVLDFGVMPLGAATRELPLAITNSGRVPLRWATRAVAGSAADRFAIEGNCGAGAGLAPGGNCTLQVRALASAPGRYDATLVLWPEHADEPLLVTLRATVVAAGAVADATWPAAARPPAEPSLQAEPPALVFDAVVGQAAAAQSIWLHNAGNRAWLLASQASTSAAFELEAVECQAGILALLPGERCRSSLRWTGQPAAATATLQAAGDQPDAITSVPLQVSEDPAQRSNLGSGAGAASIGWLTLLALAAAVLQCARPRQRGSRGAALKAISDVTDVTDN